jgi:hypothetical protein
MAKLMAKYSKTDLLMVISMMMAIQILTER